MFTKEDLHVGMIFEASDELVLKFCSQELIKLEIVEIGSNLLEIREDYVDMNSLPQIKCWCAASLLGFVNRYQWKEYEEKPFKYNHDYVEIRLPEIGETFYPIKIEFSNNLEFWKSNWSAEKLSYSWDFSPYLDSSARSATFITT